MKPGASNYRHPSPHHTHPESRGTDTPTPGDQTSEVRVYQGWAPCRGSRGGSFPPLAASRGSRRLSLGRWPPLRLHVASPLRPCFSSCVSNEDPVMGFRATCIQEEPHLRPFGPSPLQILSFQVTPHSKVLGGDFLGGPVARSPHSQHRRPGFDPWSGK